MAITYHQVPMDISPSGNPLTYNFSSSQTGQPNFSFIVETYVNGSKIAEEKIFPQVSSNAFRDISESVDGIISSPSVFNSLSNESGTLADINIKVFENYGTPAINQGSLTSAVTKAFKARISNKRFETLDFIGDYENTLFMTNFPRTENIKVLRGQDVVTSMLVSGAGVLSIAFYDTDGVFMETIDDPQTFELWQLNLNSTILGPLMVGNIDDVGTFEVLIEVIGESETLTFEYVDTTCNAPVSVLWMNEYGSYDTFVFEHADNRKGRIEKVDTYRKQFGQWVGTTYVYNSADSGDIDFAKTKRDAGTLVSDFLNEAIQNWLVEIYASPSSLLFYVDGSTLAVRITKKGFKYEQERYEDLIVEVVDYQDVNITKSVNR